MVILASAPFAVRYMYHTTKSKIPGQLVFGQDMILPINHVVDWRCVHQRRQTQIDNYVIRENTTIIDHNYREGNKVMTLTKSAFKYKTPYRVPYKKFQMWTNGNVTLIMGAVTTRINIRNIKPYNTPVVEGRYPAYEVYT